MQWERMDMIKT